MSSAKPRVAVLFGGPSSEHAISCVTAVGVLEAIDRSMYDVLPIGVTRSGKWVQAGDQLSGWELSAGHLPEVSGDSAPVLLSAHDGAAELALAVEAGSGGAASGGAGNSGSGDSGAVDSGARRALTSLGGVDVVFPLFHGPFGEDGTVQGMLELARVPYVGSGVLASAVGMDKEFMKIVFAHAGLAVGPYEVISDRDWRFHEADSLQRAAGLGWPVFVKPARAGSSVGITKASSLAELRAGVELARAEDPKVIVEAGLEGREIECGVLQGRDGQPNRASLPGEIVTAASHNLYDFEAKYLDADGAALSCPADLPEAVIADLQEQAVRGFEAVNAEGLSRVDFFYTPEGKLVVNEINTMPGFTPISMYPRMWEASGIGYTELIDELLQLALNRRVGLR